MNANDKEGAIREKVAAIVDRRLDPTSTSRYGTLGLAQFRHGLHVSSLALKPVPRAEVTRARCPLIRANHAASSCCLKKSACTRVASSNTSPG